MSRPPEASQLVDSEFWDRYWEGVEIPAVVRKGDSLYVDAITDVLDRYLASDRRLSVLEVGGAPGQYAAYVATRLGHEVAVLDTSPLGCRKTRANFDLLGIDGAVHDGDVTDPPPIGPFDAVYSLGLIEHASSPQDAVALVAAHARLLGAGGTLVLGCPNLRGINGVVARFASPAFLSIHNRWVMDAGNWTEFERSAGLQRLFRGYVGGFEPSMFWRVERRGRPAQLLRLVLAAATAVLGSRRLRLLRRVNGSLWSGYLIGAYRLPPTPDRPRRPVIDAPTLS